jgi:hypothetical protein
MTRANGHGANFLTQRPDAQDNQVTQWKHKEHATENRQRIRPEMAAPGPADADFAILGEDQHGNPALVSLHGIELPGLGASLAIAQEVVVMAAGQAACPVRGSYFHGGTVNTRSSSSLPGCMKSWLESSVK